MRAVELIGEHRVANSKNHKNINKNTDVPSQEQTALDVALETFSKYHELTFFVVNDLISNAQKIKQKNEQDCNANKSNNTNKSKSTNSNSNQNLLKINSHALGGLSTFFYYNAREAYFILSTYLRLYEQANGSGNQKKKFLPLRVFHDAETKHFDVYLDGEAVAVIAQMYMILERLNYERLQHDENGNVITKDENGEVRKIADYFRSYRQVTFNSCKVFFGEFRNCKEDSLKSLIQSTKKSLEQCHISDKDKKEMLEVWRPEYQISTKHALLDSEHLQGFFKQTLKKMSTEEEEALYVNTMLKGVLKGHNTSDDKLKEMLTVVYKNNLSHFSEKLLPEIKQSFASYNKLLKQSFNDKRMQNLYEVVERSLDGCDVAKETQRLVVDSACNEYRSKFQDTLKTHVRNKYTDGIKKLGTPTPSYTLLEPVNKQESSKENVVTKTNQKTGTGTPIILPPAVKFFKIWYGGIHALTSSMHCNSLMAKQKAGDYLSFPAKNSQDVGNVYTYLYVSAKVFERIGKYYQKSKMKPKNTVAKEFVRLYETYIRKGNNTTKPLLSASSKKTKPPIKVTVENNVWVLKVKQDLMSCLLLPHFASVSYQEYILYSSGQKDKLLRYMEDYNPGSIYLLMQAFDGQKDTWSDLYPSIIKLSEAMQRVNITQEELNAWNEEAHRQIHKRIESKRKEILQNKSNVSEKITQNTLQSIANTICTTRDGSDAKSKITEVWEQQCDLKKVNIEDAKDIGEKLKEGIGKDLSVVVEHFYSTNPLESHIPLVITDSKSKVLHGEKVTIEDDKPAKLKFNWVCRKDRQSSSAEDKMVLILRGIIPKNLAVSFQNNDKKAKADVVGAVEKFLKKSTTKYQDLASNFNKKVNNELTRKFGILKSLLAHKGDSKEFAASLNKVRKLEDWLKEQKNTSLNENKNANAEKPQADYTAYLDYVIEFLGAELKKQQERSEVLNKRKQSESDVFSNIQNALRTLSKSDLPEWVKSRITKYNNEIETIKKSIKGAENIQKLESFKKSKEVYEGQISRFESILQYRSELLPELTKYENNIKKHIQNKKQKSQHLYETNHIRFVLDDKKSSLQDIQVAIEAFRTRAAPLIATDVMKAKIKKEQSQTNNDKKRSVLESCCTLIQKHPDLVSQYSDIRSLQKAYTLQSGLVNKVESLCNKAVYKKEAVVDLQGRLQKAIQEDGLITEKARLDFEIQCASLEEEVKYEEKKQTELKAAQLKEKRAEEQLKSLKEKLKDAHDIFEKKEKTNKHVRNAYKDCIKAGDLGTFTSKLQTYSDRLNAAGNGISCEDANVDKLYSIAVEILGKQFNFSKVKKLIHKYEDVESILKAKESSQNIKLEEKLTIISNNCNQNSNFFEEESNSVMKNCIVNPEKHRQEAQSKAKSVKVVNKKNKFNKRVVEGATQKSSDVKRIEGVGECDEQNQNQNLKKDEGVVVGENQDKNQNENCQKPEEFPELSMENKKYNKNKNTKQSAKLWKSIKYNQNAVLVPNLDKQNFPELNPKEGFNLGAEFINNVNNKPNLNNPLNEMYKGYIKEPKIMKNNNNQNAKPDPKNELSSTKVQSTQNNTDPGKEGASK